VREVKRPEGAAVPKRDGYIPGVPCWIDTSQPDPESAVSFYGGLFGWDLEDVMPAGSPGRYYIARLNGGDVAAISSAQEGGPSAAIWNTYVWVESADETAAKVTQAGGTVLAEPFDVMDSGRMAVFADPEGAVFSVWQAKQHRGAQVVNEAGSLNFNGLNCRDPEAAKSFYGAVFGWQTLAMDGGVEMWTLPGYGDHLELSNPGLRERIAGMGVPAEFVDVVASINPIPGEQAQTPAHWSVTFAVEDADQTAERASALGGTVVVPPFDAPWVRTTVIADPQGATFIASKFEPANRDVATPTAASTSAA
jgi:predicted enzyme related to lactoylglutathione lyase